MLLSLLLSTWVHLRCRLPPERMRGVGGYGTQTRDSDSLPSQVWESPAVQAGAELLSVVGPRPGMWADGLFPGDAAVCVLRDLETRSPSTWVL